MNANLCVTANFWCRCFGRWRVFVVCKHCKRIHEYEIAQLASLTQVNATMKVAMITDFQISLQVAESSDPAMMADLAFFSDNHVVPRFEMMADRCARINDAMTSDDGVGTDHCFSVLVTGIVVVCSGRLTDHTIVGDHAIIANFHGIVNGSVVANTNVLTDNGRWADVNVSAREFHPSASSISHVWSESSLTSAKCFSNGNVRPHSVAFTMLSTNLPSCFL